MTDDLLTRIEAALQERETLRRQNAAVAELAGILDEMRPHVEALQDLLHRGTALSDGPSADSGQAAGGEQPMAALAAPAETRSHTRRRYTETDAREWAAALRKGLTQTKVCETFEVAHNTLRDWLRKLRLDPVTGADLDGGEANADEPDPARPAWATAAVTHEAHFGNVQALEAASLMTQHGATLEQAASRFAVDAETVRRAFRRLDIDEDTGKCVKRRPLEELLKERDFAR